MIFILNPYKNIYFHLATEEYLLNHLETGFIMLWEAEKSVVIGKHQNALKEINFPYVQENKINVARRISGGGTVYHDKGNLNFTIVAPIEENQSFQVNYKKYLEPVIQYLETLGIEAAKSENNDLIINGLKVSGNAQHHGRKQHKILHHGTLLFDADLKTLGAAIKGAEEIYKDKSVASKRKNVENIQYFLKNKINFDSFKAGLQDYLVKHYNIQEIRDLSCDETDQIEALAVTKFEKWEWNYGYSPAYQLNKSFDMLNHHFVLDFNVERGGKFLKSEVVTKPNNEIGKEISGYLMKGSHHPEYIQNVLDRLNSINLNKEEKQKLLFSFF
jgi:lipoate---protein ligase